KGLPLERPFASVVARKRMIESSDCGLLIQAAFRLGGTPVFLKCRQVGQRQGRLGVRDSALVPTRSWLL
ncbi:MAG: hypothetical protein VX346_09795, partial [Planctomycetota bacterium]|nr:hypothetical protein [Planctomycetota bacterium]